jgi:hypothetical protein
MVGGLAHSGRVIFAAGAETVAVFPTFAGEEDRGSSLASRSRSTRCSSADVSRMKISIVYEACSATRIRLPRRVPTAYGRRILRKPRFTDWPIRPRGNPVPPTRKNASRCREMCSYGARSPNSIIRLTRSLAATIPTARTHQIEGAGHAAPFNIQFRAADRRHHHLRTTSDDRVIGRKALAIFPTASQRPAVPSPAFGVNRLDQKPVAVEAQPAIPARQRQWHRLRGGVGLVHPHDPATPTRKPPSVAFASRRSLHEGSIRYTG